MRQRRRLFPLFVLICVGFAADLRAQAPGLTAPSTSDSISDQWSRQLHEFVEKIAIAAGTQRAISLALNNISGLDTPRVRSLETDLRAELKQAGFQVSPVGAQADVKIEVTLSKSAGGYLWIAQLLGPADEQVVIEAVDDAQAAQESPRAAPILRKTLVQTQADPMLDFAEIASANETVRVLLLLEPDRVVAFTGSGGAWAQRDSAPIAHARPWPRDVRGRLALDAGSGFHVFLPGVLCAGNWSGALNLSCRQDSAAWKLDDAGQSLSFEPGRNYFSGSASAANGEGGAYSIALDSAADSLRWIAAGEDGNARLFRKGEIPAILPVHWGDDLATLATRCGGEWNLFASGAGDWTQPDILQTYEIDSESATAAGEPLAFTGPVLALWPSEDGKSVRAISRNLETGRYEASTVSVSCGN